MDILGPVPNTNTGNLFVLVTTDWYTKLTKNVLLAKQTASITADAFLTNLVYKFGIPDYLLTENGYNFISKSFSRICSSLHIKQLYTSTFYPQTNGPAERFNCTIAIRLRHYVTEHRQNWDLSIELLTYGYKRQIHRSTVHNPFKVCLSRQPHNPIFLGPTRNTPSDIPVSITLSTNTTKLRCLKQLEGMLNDTDANLRFVRTN